MFTLPSWLRRCLSLRSSRLVDCLICAFQLLIMPETMPEELKESKFSMADLNPARYYLRNLALIRKYPIIFCTCTTVFLVQFGMVRHRLCLVFPLPSWLRHRLCAVLRPGSSLSHRTSCCSARYSTPRR